YWAGYAGAALGTLMWAGQQANQTPPLTPITGAYDKETLVKKVTTALSGQTPTALITGALGRCGRGATDFLEAVGVTPTKWDMAETQSGGPFPEILEHELFVNCVLASPSCPVFVPTDAPTRAGRKLTAIADVSCDPGSSYNPIPVYDQTTTFTAPAIELKTEGEPLAVTAIDHLPSLLPLESTEDYSAQLTEALLTLDKPDQGVWARAHAEFTKHMARV
ncbi:MAG: saccharopine dehydrogenase, partial [Pikeienuella sp.]